jgi:uncharacterized protein (TIGR03435 family)
MVWMAGAAMLLGSALHAQDVAGNWQGTLETGEANGLRLLLKVSKADGGGWKAMMFSIDQGGHPIAVTSLTAQGLEFNFTIKPLELTYVGTMNAEHTAVTGHATQHGATHVLDLQRVTEDAAWAVPEPPKPMAADATPKFDVVTVKPSDPTRPGKLFTIRGRHVMTINTTVSDLITFGYSIQTKQIAHAPAWLDEKYDIDGVPDVEGQPNVHQMRTLVRDVLVERFGLKFHYDHREMSVYALTVAKSGEKLTVTTDKPSDPGNFMFGGLGKLTVTNSSMKDFCDGMQEAVMDKPVVDQTGLKGRYDFNLNWTPDETQFVAMGVRIPPPNQDDPNAPPSLYTALQEQVGLKMTATKAQAEVMDIDHLEKPSAN